MSSILDRSPSCGHGAVSSPSSPARSSCNRALCSLPVCPLTIGAGPSRHWRSGRPRLRNRRSATGRARRQEARSGHRGAPPRRPRSPARRMASRETAQANRADASCPSAGAGNSDVRRCVKRRGLRPHLTALRPFTFGTGRGDRNPQDNGIVLWGRLSRAPFTPLVDPREESNLHRVPLVDG